MSDELNHPARSWNDMFAALPDEVPPGDGWARLSRALDAAEVQQRSPIRRRWSFAIAAAVAVLAPVLVLRMVDRDAGADPAATASHGAAESFRATRPAGRAAVEPMVVSTASKQSDAAEADEGARVADRARATRLERDVSAAQGGHPAGRRAIAATEPTRGSLPSTVSLRAPDARNAARTAAGAATAERIAIAPAPASMHALASAGFSDTAVLPPPSGHDTATSEHASRRAPAAIARAESSATARTDPLQPLYTESAQLEALLALTRDDRVGSATGAALSDALVDRLASVDAALAQSGLPDAQRAALWRERVATLRQLAGVESTERWLAMHGRAYGDAFVRVD
jgi:hypothetical protein